MATVVVVDVPDTNTRGAIQAPAGNPSERRSGVVVEGWCERAWNESTAGGTFTGGAVMDVRSEGKYLEALKNIGRLADERPVNDNIIRINKLHLNRQRSTAAP